jgi:hypothetical protein
MVRLSVLPPAVFYTPEILFFCFWYSFLLEAESTPGNIYHCVLNTNVSEELATSIQGAFLMKEAVRLSETLVSTCKTIVSTQRTAVKAPNLVNGNKLNSVALVRERAIPTEQPSKLVSTYADRAVSRGQCGGSLRL